MVRENMETRSEMDIACEGLEPFTVTQVEAVRPRVVAVFAAGRGGHPKRHLHLLQALASKGCTVIAPHFEMMISNVPTKAKLDMRLLRLEETVDRFAPGDLPVVGIGHSIGSVVLLALQGAEGVTLDGQQLATGSNPRLERLALLAPPTDFFRRPGALHRLKMPMKIWVGAKDTITPRAQSRFLMDTLADQASVAVQVDPDAGHFTYMDELPPGMPEPHPDRSTFLAGLADEITSFLFA
jgi:pimeloyl-ACP methyl ester carboxylesterase